MGPAAACPTRRISTPKLLAPLFATHPSSTEARHASSFESTTNSSRGKAATYHCGLLHSPHQHAIVACCIACHPPKQYRGKTSKQCEATKSPCGRAAQHHRRLAPLTASAHQSCSPHCSPPSPAAQRQAVAGQPGCSLTGGGLGALARSKQCCSQPSRLAGSKQQS